MDALKVLRGRRTLTAAAAGKSNNNKYAQSERENRMRDRHSKNIQNTVEHI